MFVIVCYYVQQQTEAYETLPLCTTAWLACFAHVGVLALIHSADIDVPMERIGEGLEMCAWKLSSPWLRSAGFRSAVFLRCNSAQCTVFFFFLKRWWLWPETVHVLGNLHMFVIAKEVVSEEAE